MQREPTDYSHERTQEAFPIHYDVYSNPYEYNPYTETPPIPPPPPTQRQKGFWLAILLPLCGVVLISGALFVGIGRFTGIQRPSAIGGNSTTVVTATVATPTIPTNYTAQDIFVRLDQAGVIQHDYTENVLQGPRETYLLPPTVKPSSGVIFGYGNAEPYALLVFATYASTQAASAELFDESSPLPNMFYGRCLFDPSPSDPAVSSVLQKWCV